MTPPSGSPRQAGGGTRPIAASAADVVILARTVYGEARGEGWLGMLAVAWVVRNRAERGGWWGGTIAEVCRAPHQFSCWSEGDPNRAAVEAATLDDGIYQDCKAAALLVVRGRAQDPTCGATHYHARVRPAWAKAWPPAWAFEADGRRRAYVSISGHCFYRGVP